MAVRPFDVERTPVKQRIVQLKPAGRKIALGMVMAVAFAALLLAACGRGEKSGTDSTAKLPEAYNFELTVYQGESVLGRSTISLSKLRGKPVVLNFWAGLCAPCRAEMPEFESVYQEYRGKITLVGIDIGPFVGLGSLEDGKKLLKELGVTYPVGTTSDASVVRNYGVLGMPTTVFVTPDGKVLRKWLGLLTKSKLVELTEELLAASKRD